MNTNKIIQFTFAALTVAVVAVLGLTKHSANYLSIISIIVSYVTVAGMLVLASTDNRGNKRLQ